jgi:hypothetical protein
MKTEEKESLKINTEATEGQSLPNREIMRKEFLELKKLGRIPNESIDDDESVDNIITSYDLILEKITLPITYEEGEILIKLFPENAFYDLQWSLLKLIESLVEIVDNGKYRILINQCPSIEWKSSLNVRFNNWLEKQRNVSEQGN